MEGARAAAMVLALVGLLGCTSDTEIIGSVELAGERLALDVNGSVTSIGLIDGWVLLTVVTGVAPPPGWPDHVVEGRIYWVSPEGRLSEGPSLGWATTLTLQPRWVRNGDRLASSVWAVPDPGAARPSDAEIITMWELAPDGTSCHSTPTLPVWTDPDLGTVLWTGQIPYSGTTAPPPVVALADHSVLGLAEAVPSQCGPYSFYQVLGVRLDGCDVSLEWVTNRDAPCALRDHQVGDPTPVRIGDSVGVLYRPFGEEETRVFWMRLDAGLEPIGSPVLVGGISLYTSGGYAQPIGAAAGGRVLFFERFATFESCFALRQMDADGSRAGDAPWQLPCTRDGNLWSTHVELFETGDAAIAFANGAPNRIDHPSSTDRTHVYATLLTPSGRRGSAIIDVAAASAQGSASFVAAVDGTDAAVVYGDDDGIWLQRVRVTR